MILSMETDFGIGTLLDLHDEAFDQGDGYWVKIEAWRVSPTPAIPHGIRYSLTLHGPYDHRHRHAADKGVPYEFKDAHQLLVDFFAEVDRVLEEVKQP